MKYTATCESCGERFEAIRAASQNPPRFCSRACFGASLGKPMRTYEVDCGWCDTSFVEKRASDAPPPKYCSHDCYSEDRRGTSYSDSKRRGRVKVGERADGSPIYMQRSHWVWNQHNPDDPVEDGQIIHHIDHDPSNDDISNLAKLDWSDHQRYHANQIESEERSRRMKAYHAANPGAHRKGEPKNCPVCGVEFYRPPSAKAQTCSYECMGRLMSMKTD